MWFVTVTTVALVVLCAYLIVARQWRRWMKSAADEAFARTDTNGSGTIDRAELYTGVLEVYLRLHRWGIKCARLSRTFHVRVSLQALR